MKPFLLLTGASGLLGGALLRVLTADYTVIACHHESPIRSDITGIKKVKADLTDADSTLELFSEQPVDLVVNCAAATEVDRCETDHNHAIKGNEIIVANLLKGIAKSNCRLIHFSTDYVFNGRKGQATEADEPNPICYYGKSKLAAEKMIRQADVAATIIRVCALYSTNLTAKPNLYNKTALPLRQGEKYLAADNLMTTPTEVNDLAGAIGQVISQPNLPPLLHLAAPECLSRYQFAIMVARQLGLNPKLVERRRVADLNLPAPRPLNAGLASSVANRLLDRQLRSFSQLY
ncbi:MAG: SDR family oxidoreductase [candidate division Zixibacteria bacterium]|nr:SDR family oxidoreductase [candidate division Zixibacteria bacterium]